MIPNQREKTAGSHVLAPRTHELKLYHKGSLRGGRCRAHVDVTESAPTVMLVNSILSLEREYDHTDRTRNQDKHAAGDDSRR